MCSSIHEGQHVIIIIQIPAYCPETRYNEEVATIHKMHFALCRLVVDMRTGCGAPDEKDIVGEQPVLVDHSTLGDFEPRR